MIRCPRFVMCSNFKILLYFFFHYCIISIIITFIIYNIIIKLHEKVTRDRNTYFTRHLRWLKSSIFLVYLGLIEKNLHFPQNQILFLSFYRWNVCVVNNIGNYILYMASSSTYGNDIVGRRVEVLWERDSNASNTNAVDNSGVGWYRGTVAAYDVSRQEHLVEYDDGDKDWYDLGKVQFRLLLETAVETVPSQTNSASNQTPSSDTLNGDSTLDSTLGGNSTIHVEADDTQHEISMDEDAAIGHNSRILSPTTKVNEALKHTKSIEESSIANASGIYEELEQTAIVLKQKSAEIQQKQHEQSRQIYRAQVMLSDEATSIANDVERRIRTEALELHKKFTTIAKRMQRDKKTLKKYQRDTERYKKDILRGDGERQNLEKRNLVLRDKIKELENTIENLRKRLKINEWKSSKAMKKIKEERETQKSQQLALMKNKMHVSDWNEIFSKVTAAIKIATMVLQSLKLLVPTLCRIEKHPFCNYCLV